MKLLCFSAALLLAALLVTAPALGALVADEQAAALGVRDIEGAIPDEARELMGDATAADASPGAFGFLLDALREKSVEILKSSLGGCLAVLAAVLLCGVLGSLSDSAPPRAVLLAGVLAITAVTVTETGSMMRQAGETIEQMDIFIKLLLPSVAAAMTASGHPGAGAALYAATMAFSDALIALINRCLMPLTTAYIAASAANAALGGDLLGRMAKAIKRAVTVCLTAIMLVYVGYLSISGVAAASADALSVKAAKTTLSTVVPVVGGIMSDAADTILSSAALLKNSLGLFGMLAVLAMTVLPFLRAGARYLLYKLTAALCSTVGGSELSGLVDDISAAFGLVLAMTGSCALMFLISLVSAVRMTM